jgi:hypothetical protein
MSVGAEATDAALTKKLENEMCMTLATVYDYDISKVSLKFTRTAAARRKPIYGSLLMIMLLIFVE